MTENTSPTPPESLRENIVVVIPCYNAGEHIQPVAEQALKFVEHVIVINDGSTDGAVAALEALPVRIVAFAKNRGKGHALLAGFRAALEIDAAQGVCMLDADGQHDPAELPKLFDALRAESADLVIGSRVFTQAHVPWRSRFGNRLTAALAGILLGRRFPDTQSGYRMMSRRFVEDLLENIAGGRYETEMEMLVRAVRGGFRIQSAPIATLYDEGNRTSHFHKVRDSFLVYARLFHAVFKHRGR